MQQVDQECPIGLKWKWSDDQTEDQINFSKTELTDWIRTNPTSHKYNTSITNDGLEIRVALLTDMPTMVEWALTNTSTSLHPTPALIVSRGPMEGRKHDNSNRILLPN